MPFVYTRLDIGGFDPTVNRDFIASYKWTHYESHFAIDGYDLVLDNVLINSGELCNMLEEHQFT